jgi:TctA family transporter
LERSLRQALTISGGDLSIFLQDYLTIGLLVAAAIFLVLGLLPSRKLSLRDD